MFNGYQRGMSMHPLSLYGPDIVKNLLVNASFVIFFCFQFHVQSSTLFLKMLKKKKKNLMCIVRDAD